MDRKNNRKEDERGDEDTLENNEFSSDVQGDIQKLGPDDENGNNGDEMMRLSDVVGEIKTKTPLLEDKTDDSGDEGKSSCDHKEDNGGHSDTHKPKQNTQRIGVIQVVHKEDEEEKEEEPTPAKPRYVRTLYSKPEICVEFPYDYKEPLKAVPVSNEQKNSQILDMPPNIKERSERLGSRDRSEMFMIKGKFLFAENCKVIVKFGGDKDCDRYLNFCAVIKQGKVWLEVPAERKENYVHFETKRMEYFYIMSSPVTTVLELMENAPLRYVHVCDPQTTVFFEEGTVHIKTQISIKVLPVSKKAVEALKTSFPNPIIENMSPCLSVTKAEGRDFKKSARVQLPFKPSPRYKTLVVRLDDEKAEISDTNLKDNGDGTYSCDVKAVNTYVKLQLFLQ